MSSRKIHMAGKVRNFQPLNGANWNDRLLASQFVLTFLTLLHAWTLQYKSSDGNANYVSRISYTVNDPPWTPPGTFSNPILHLHHFGDWTLALAYSVYSRPYDPSLHIPAVTPPFGLLLLRMVSILGAKLSFLALGLVTAILWWLVIAHFMEFRSLLGKVQILVLIILLTTPSIVAFDRGALHLFLFGLVGYSFMQYRKKKFVSSMIAFVCIVSFKPYLIVLALWLIREKRFKQLLITIALAVGVNLVSMIIFTGNIFSGVINYLHASAEYSGAFIIPWVMDSASFMGFLSKVVEGLRGSRSAEIFLRNYIGFSWIFTVIYIVFIYLIVRNRNVPDFLALTLLLASSSLITPPALEYTLVWASLAMILVLSYFEDKNKEIRFNKTTPQHLTLLRASYVACGLLFLSILTPYFGLMSTPSGVVRHNPNTYFYIPLMIPVVVFALIYAFTSSEKTIPGRVKTK